MKSGLCGLKPLTLWRSSISSLTIYQCLLSNWPIICSPVTYTNQLSWSLVDCEGPSRLGQKSWWGSFDIWYQVCWAEYRFFHSMSMRASRKLFILNKLLMLPISLYLASTGQFLYIHALCSHRHVNICKCIWSQTEIVTGKPHHFCIRNQMSIWNVNTYCQLYVFSWRDYITVSPLCLFKIIKQFTNSDLNKNKKTFPSHFTILFMLHRPATAMHSQVFRLFAVFSLG